MERSVEGANELTQLQRAASSIRKLRGRLEAVEYERREPVAVIGVGCRFPKGANSPESFWRLLMDGVDLISEVPPDRWDADALFAEDPRTPGRMNTRWGGFVDSLDQFDPAFFGISPREAARMDPQQRLLLETAFEALEDAGQPLPRWAGGLVGVFAGVHSHSSDYFLMQAADLSDLGTHTSTSTAHSIIANRLSYCFDWRGPSVAVDTACSSSLVAVHLAVQSLRNRECELALAAGVNLVLRPETTVALSKLRMMAPDGRCKTFDARADGFVRGEGCGAVVLKRLSDALREGDPILAVIAGTATNQDGTTNGLAAPNGRSQEMVIRQALEDAGADPSDITYVETHGTGTALGDPIEVEALAEVIGREGDRPCVLGSVKTNLGHLEGAAGIAGLIKAVLALKHGRIPPNLHFRELNPHISLDRTRLVIATEAQPWDTDGERLAGVSSFGFGGTNAHVILRSAPEPGPTDAAEQASPATSAPVLLPLSARDGNALPVLARAYVDHLESADSSLGDIAFTAGARRSHHEFRLAVVASTAEEMSDRLRGFLGGAEHPAVASGRASRQTGAGPVFVFSGQGPQWHGMAGDLLEGDAVFRESMESCDALYRDLTGESLIEELVAGEDRSRLGRTDIAQPVIFALQTSLAAVWRRWGLEPEAIVGHSAGEVAAAHVAGALTLEDAMRVAVQRGRVMEQVPRGGRMAAVELPEGKVRGIIENGEHRVEVAALNSPGWTVISGEAGGVEAVVEGLLQGEIVCRYLPVDRAYHSAEMEQCRGELVEVLRDIDVRPARIPIRSAVRGAAAEPGDFDGAYWGRNVREPVRFSPAIADLLDAGHTHFIEIGPHPVLCSMVDACSRAAGIDALPLPSLRRDHPGRTTLLASMARLYATGYNVGSGLYPKGGRVVPLPRYPWQRRRYWFTPSGPPGGSSIRSASTPMDGGGERVDATVPRPLPGRRLRSVIPTFECLAQRDLGRYMDSHRIHGRPVLPASIHLDWILRGVAEAQGSRPAGLSDLVFHRPLIGGDPADPRLVQLAIPDGPGGQARFAVCSAPAVNDPGTEGGIDDGAPVWTVHAEGTVSSGEAPSQGDVATLDVEALRRDCPDVMEGAEFYGELENRGVLLGGAFRSVERLWRGEGQLLGRIEPSAPDVNAGVDAGAVLLDGALQCALGLLMGTEDGFRIVAGLDRLWFGDPARGFPGDGPVWCHARGRPEAKGVQADVRADLILFDEGLAPIAGIRGIALRRVGPGELADQGGRAPTEWFFELGWEDRPLPVGSETGTATLEPVDPATIAEQVAQAEVPEGDAEKSDVLAGLEGLASAYAARALATLGHPRGRPRDEALEDGGRDGMEAAATNLGVSARHARYLRRLFELAGGHQEPLGSEDGAAGPVPDMEALAAEAESLAERHPEHATVVRLLRRSGEALPAVLRGETDPLELLFGERPGVEELYRDAPSCRTYNARVAQAVASAVARIPENRSARILEIGAGTGGTTGAVVDRLPADRTEYLFTDISPALVRTSADRFAGTDFMRFETLDIEAPDTPAGGFDVVVAANVLHATRDLRRTLANVRKLLAPGGLLVLLETTARRGWVDLVFGMTDGWWGFEDLDLRSDHPLLGTTEWLDLLRNSGFTDPVTATADPAEHGVLPQALILAAAPAATSGRWAILTRGSPLGEAVAAGLAARGGTCVMVSPGDEFDVQAPGRLTVRPNEAEDYRRLLRALRSNDDSLEGVIHLWAAECADGIPGASTTHGAIVADGSLAPVLLAQALAAERELRPTPIWLVTTGAQAVDADEGSDGAPLQAPLWGLGRSLAFEYPGSWGGLVDLDPAEPVESAAEELLGEIAAGDGEDEVAYREGRRRVARLGPVRPPAIEPISFRDDATYLITGGLGDLGRRLSRWMVENGARSLVLTGRRTLPTGAGESASTPPGEEDGRLAALRELEATGAQVRYAAVDVSDPAAMAELIDGLRDEPRPLRGVVHAAAGIDPCPLADLDAAAFDATLEGKARGAWILHEQTRDLALDFFVLFSSTTSLLGSRDLAHYAAANQFLDALAWHRAALGLPALAINWGTWGALTALSEDRRRTVARSGLLPMDSSAALDALGRLLNDDAVQRVVARIDAPVLSALFESGRRSRVLLPLRGVADSPATPGAPGTPAPPEETGASPGRRPASAPVALVEAVAGAVASERRGRVAAVVAGEVRSILGMDPNQTLDPEKGLFELGMDSLMTVQLKDRLERALGQSLPATLTLNYPNISALSGYLNGRLEEFGPGASSGADREGDPDATLRAEVGKLSDEETRRLLEAELEELESGSDRESDEEPPVEDPASSRRRAGAGEGQP